MESSKSEILDVTLLEPKQKHPTVFEYFDELGEGEHFILHNDHDPKPLYYQMLAERGNVFSWEYTEQGPKWWKVIIRKRRSDEKEETVGMAVAKDVRAIEIFRNSGIDFYCGGKRTIKEVCAEKGLDVAAIEQDLIALSQTKTNEVMPYNDWSLDFLCDFIVNTHHSYINRMIPDLKSYGAKVATVHGDHHPELKQIYELITKMSGALTAHMMKEERIVFPYIKLLLTVGNDPTKLADSGFDSVRTPVNLMEMEHELITRDAELIRQTAKNYALPEDACASYTLLFKMLEDFERDLQLHVHLENNILFPKAIELEQSIQS